MQSYVGDAVWQLPQGGIEPLEPSREAAFRELWEETGVRNASLIGEILGWLTYELPPELIGVALKGKYAGHRLRWYAMRFDGGDSEIDIGPKGPMKSEFDAWRWVPLTEVPSLAVDFRRSVYEEVVLEFSRFARRRPAPIGAFDTTAAK
jgi:putative (di)nucleoside polyphosphate hydrolase